MTRKILLGALLGTLLLGTMTAGVRAGDEGRSPAAGRELAAMSERAELVGRDLAGRRGCQTLKCINRTLKAIIKALNGLCVIPFDRFGNGNDDNTFEGYMYDTDLDDTKNFNTTALDLDLDGFPGALMVIDCP
jgi:hypothetical protein